MKNKLCDIISKNAEKEFAKYKNHKLTEDKEAIFNKAFEIDFYISVHDYLTFDDIYAERLTERDLEFIASEKEHFMSSLFDFYLKFDNYDIDNYNDIYDLIYEYCRRYNK